MNYEQKFQKLDKEYKALLKTHSDLERKFLDSERLTAK
jgi:hypothetical protein